MHIFFRKPFFDQFFFKNTNFAPPPENCAQKNLPKTPIFIGSKKDGQVIDPTMAKLLTLKWPKYGQAIDPTAYIYIYIYMPLTPIGWAIFRRENVKEQRREKKNHGRKRQR